MPRNRSPVRPIPPLLAAALLLSACGTSGPAAAPAGPVTVAGVAISRDQALHDSLPASIRDSGVVRVASDVPYPPFEMFVTEGKPELTGLDYDLGQAIAGKLGVRFEFTPQKFDGIVPAIQAGRFEVAISAMTDTRDRQAVLDFVDYSVSGSAVLVLKGNPQRIATLVDLCGRTVGAQAATKQVELLEASQQDCRAAGKQAIDVKTFPKDSDAQLALRAGNVQAQVLTKPAAGWTAKTADGGARFEVVEDPAAPGGYGSSPNGIGVSKKLPELAKAVQGALQALMDDGTVKKIFAGYGVESIALTEATMNAAVS